MRPLGAERTCVAAGRHSPREPGLQHVQGPASWRMAACELAAQKGGHCLPLRPPPVTPRRLFPCLPLTETRVSKSPLRHLLPPPDSRVNRRTQSLAHRPCGVWACSTGPGPGEGDLLPSRLWSPASCRRSCPGPGSHTHSSQERSPRPHSRLGDEWGPGLRLGSFSSSKALGPTPVTGTGSARHPGRSGRELPGSPRGTPQGLLLSHTLVSADGAQAWCPLFRKLTPCTSTVYLPLRVQRRGPAPRVPGSRTGSGLHHPVILSWQNPHLRDWPWLPSSPLPRL